MNAGKRIRLIAIPMLLIVLYAGLAFGAESRPGKFVTIEGQQVSFFRIEGRESIKGWHDGIAIEVPMDTVSQVVFFDSPSVSYSMFGNEISAGAIELTRRLDGKTFLLQDAFLPSSCNCTYLTYSYRNPFTDEMNQANAAIDGLRKIVFEDKR